jgi:serine/threonine protein kinase
MAPQVLQGVYSSQADMWSLGVISYMVRLVAMGWLIF